MQDVIEKKIQKFFSSYPLRRYNQRHILIYTDDSADCIYYLIRGKVKQYSISDNGDEFVLNVFKAHAFFPMSHIVTNTRARYLFEAEDTIEVYKAPAKDVIHFVRTNPDVLYDLLRRVYVGTEGMLGRMEQLMYGSAKTRLCYELVLEAQRFGTKTHNGGCTIHMSEKLLGSCSGLARETVNREIHKLKELGLVIIKRNAIVIPDISALEKSFL